MNGEVDFNNFFYAGIAVNIVIVALFGEALWLAWSRRWDVMPSLLPGLLIVLALRSAVYGQSWPWVAGWLALSLPAHLWDLRRRLTSGS